MITDRTNLCIKISHHNQTKTSLNHVLHFQMFMLNHINYITLAKYAICGHSSWCISETLRRVTSKVFSIYKLHVELSFDQLGVERQHWVRRKWGLACWLRSKSPRTSQKRLLLEFNRPAIVDTLWCWEGWLSALHTNHERWFIQELQSTCWMDECDPTMRKQNKLWKKLMLHSSFHISCFLPHCFVNDTCMARVSYSS